MFQRDASGNSHTGASFSGQPHLCQCTHLPPNSWMHQSLLHSDSHSQTHACVSESGTCTDMRAMWSQRCLGPTRHHRCRNLYTLQHGGLSEHTLCGRDITVMSTLTSNWSQSSCLGFPGTGMTDVPCHTHKLSGNETTFNTDPHRREYRFMHTHTPV